jgi:hypothetical protein
MELYLDVPYTPSLCTQTQLHLRLKLIFSEYCKTRGAACMILHDTWCCSDSMILSMFRSIVVPSSSGPNSEELLTNTAMWSSKCRCVSAGLEGVKLPKTDHLEPCMV